jgi:Fungal N-terminal domain of STAND proteins
MDPLSISMAALSISTLCVSVVQKIKSIVETMKRTRQALLSLLQAAERLRLYLEVLRGLTAQLHDPSQRALHLAFNDSECRQTVVDLQAFVGKIAAKGAPFELWRKINWVYYKDDADAMVVRLQKQEGHISTLLVFIAA